MLERISANPVSVQRLVAEGELNSRDLDAIMVATGYLSYELIEHFIRARSDATSNAAPNGLPDVTVDLIALEITERICGCQYQDGGSTSLISATESRVHMKVEGACVHCPQIPYTIDILQRAIKFRAPSVRDVVVTGTHLEEGTRLPKNRQYTLALFMKTFNLTFSDLDAELQRRGRITDDDLYALAGMKRH